MRRDLLKSGIAIAVGSTLSQMGLNANAQSNGPQEGKLMILNLFWSLMSNPQASCSSA